jgi:glutamine---fructose-6-phosphate transaminase (isomerizing)
MAMRTHFFSDILRQPVELRHVLDHFSGEGIHDFSRAACTIRDASQVMITGIGASLHAAIAAASLFNAQSGRDTVSVQDASELLHFTTLPRKSVLIILSRSGRSVEIVKLLEKARQNGATVIAITAVAGTPLSRESQIPLVIPVDRDFAISVNTYTALTLAAGLLAERVAAPVSTDLISNLQEALIETERSLDSWTAKVEHSSWFLDRAPYYFLARGGSIATANEARLLWEEGAKLSATAMSTGNFRHGPQEIVTTGLRVGLWLDAAQMRDEDLALAQDLRRLGARVLLIGQRLSEEAGDLTIQIPAIPARWQFLLDVIPAQLAAEKLSRLAGVDCDSFRICSYVVEGEHGLLSPGQALPKPRS